MWIQHQANDQLYWSIYKKRTGEYWFFHKMFANYIECIIVDDIQTYPYISGSRVEFDYGTMPLNEGQRLIFSYNTGTEKEKRWKQLMENPLPFIIEALN